MNINKLLCNKYNSRGSNKIQYLVVHYTASDGGTALANANYFKTSAVEASAHYIVGLNGEIYQCVEDDKAAWAVGDTQKYVNGGATYKNKVTNYNSISIEMCVKKKSTKTLNATDTDWYFEEKTVYSTMELIRELMKKYNIPASNILRHYDVTGKLCPNPYCDFVGTTQKNAWKTFKTELTANYVSITANCVHYKNPDTANGKHCSLTKGAYVVWMADTGKGWSKVMYNGNVGYVKNTCINKAGLSKYKTGEVITDVMLRSDMKVASETAMKVLPVGTKFTIICEIGEWYQVKLEDSTTAYVVKKKCKAI